MPFVKAQEVSVPFDKDFAGEVVDTSNGSESSFGGTLANVPVYIEGVVLDYEIGSVAKQAISDANGYFSGDNVTGGSVAEDGTWTLTTDTNVDSGNITTDYRAKGFVTKLVEFLTDDRKQADELLGTGDDSTTSFSGTLSAGSAVAKGQCRLEFWVDNTKYQVWDNGEGEWIHDLITTSSLNYGTKAWSITFAQAIQDTKEIRALFSYSETEGQDWVVLTERNTRDNGGSDAYPSDILKEVILKNSGSSYKESIFIGFRECKSEANSFFAVNLNGYYQRLDDDGDWNDNAAGPSGHGKTNYDATRELYSNMPRISLNDDTIKYWLYASKNRVIAVARLTGSVFESLYVGHGKRFSAPSDYANPIVVIGSHSGINNHSDTGVDHTSIIFPRINGSNLIVVDPENTYGDTATTSGKFVAKLIPTSILSTGSVPSLDPTTTTEQLRFAIYVYLGRDDYILMALEGVYFVPKESIQSEDTLTMTIGSQVHDLFQNVHRVDYDDYMAIAAA